MDVAAMFEYPLPKLETDTEKIAVSVHNRAQGSFTVQNAGGGTLAGKILSNSPLLSFAPDTFSGKSSVITYMVNAQQREPGEIIKTSAVIMSNGGERIIPVIIKTKPSGITAKPLALRITDLKEFCRYAKKYPAEAASMFGSKTFAEFLADICYPYQDAYSELARDSNKERALDNFLVLNRLKKQSRLSVKATALTHKANPYNGEVISGAFTLLRSQWGYVFAEITKQNGVNWLTLEKSEITAKDFERDNTATVNYFIDPKQLNGVFAEEFLLINGKNPSGAAKQEQCIRVSVKSCPPFKAVLAKESFTKDERGFIGIENNTGKDMLIELEADEPCMRFENPKQTVGLTGKLAFTLKLTGIMSARQILRPKPVFPVTVTITAPEYKYARKLKLNAEM